MQDMLNSGVIEAHRANHTKVQKKCMTASLQGKTVAEQAAINGELRDAAHSHVETREWEKGGIRPQEND